MQQSHIRAIQVQHLPSHPFRLLTQVPSNLPPPLFFTKTFIRRKLLRGRTTTDVGKNATFESIETGEISLRGEKVIY